jgi:acyl carrier protein
MERPIGYDDSQESIDELKARMCEDPSYFQGHSDPVAENVLSFARAGVIARIKHVLVVVSGRPLDVMSDSTRLHEDLELDSLERIEAGQALEEEFGIALSDDEVDQACMGTIGGIADYLMTQRGVA